MDLLLDQCENLGLAGTRKYPWELHWTNIVKVTAQLPPPSFFMNTHIPLKQIDAYDNPCKTPSTEKPFKTDLAYDTL